MLKLQILNGWRGQRVDKVIRRIEGPMSIENLVGMIPRNLGREVDALAVVCRQRIMDEVLNPLQGRFPELG